MAHRVADSFHFCWSLLLSPQPGAPHEGLSAHAAHVVSKPIDAAINAVRGV